MAIKAVLARCINCKTEVKEDPAYVVCTKCGDPVKPRQKIRLELAGESQIESFNNDFNEVMEERPEVDAEVLARMSALPDFSGTLKGVQTQAGEYVGERAVRLTPEQESALERIKLWFQLGPGEPFRLFGYAGVGKTTLARHLAGALGTPHIVFGAYTGKAAHVLRRKGVPATTIHSAIYCPVDNREARAEWERVTRVLAAAKETVVVGNADDHAQAARYLTTLESQLADLEEAIRHGVEFELNPMSEWADADLIVLDEVSMVNEKMALDIESFGVPVLVLGDPAQLPPVEGGGYYTAHRPDVLLTEVHRQALESPVLALATAIRQGRSWAGQRVKVSLAEAMAADQILCWKNSTRHTLTGRIREKLSRPAGVPVAEDRVMCLVNNKDLGIFNGQQFEVDAVSRDGDEFLLKDDDGVERWFYYDPDGFRGAEGEREAKGRRRHAGKVGLFTFANVITCHKSQGSEWDSVYIVDQTDQMWRSGALEKRAWLYTAVTRASDRVTIASTNV